MTWRLARRCPAVETATGEGSDPEGETPPQRGRGRSNKTKCLNSPTDDRGPVVGVSERLSAILRVKHQPATALHLKEVRRPARHVRPVANVPGGPEVERVLVGVHW